MVNYKNGKIYKLFSYDNDLVYVGSTTQALSERLGKHKCPSNKACSKILFENSNNVKIELIENCECDNIEQLHRLEGEYIRRLDCVNKNIPGRTDKEYREDNKEQLKEYSKEWYENNKEHLKQYMKEYSENNKEQIKEREKEYREKNKEQIKERRKEYYEKSKEKRKEYREKNKEQIKERRKEYYEKSKEKNLEKKKEYDKIYREKNKEKIKEQKKEYRKKKKEKLAFADTTLAIPSDKAP